MIEKTTLTIKQIIENKGVIFDFCYPFYNEEKREEFEKHFIDHFYYDEIGLETVSKFKHRLEDKLNMIMPYYNKIFLADELEQRILDNYDVTEDSERVLNNTISSNSNSKMKNKYSDKPMTRTTITDNDYLTSINLDEGQNTNNTEGQTIETYHYQKKGNIGVQTDADAVVKYWESLRKIELEIFNECEDLFMGVF